MCWAMRFCMLLKSLNFDIFLVQRMQMMVCNERSISVTMMFLLVLYVSSVLCDLVKLKQFCYLDLSCTCHTDHNYDLVWDALVFWVNSVLLSVSVVIRLILCVMCFCLNIEIVISIFAIDYWNENKYDYMHCTKLTGQNIRKLVKDGFIIRKPQKIHSRSRARRAHEAKQKGRHSGYGILLLHWFSHSMCLVHMYLDATTFWNPEIIC